MKRKKPVLHFYTKSFTNVPRFYRILEFVMIDSISSSIQCHVSFQWFEEFIIKPIIVHFLICSTHYTVENYEPREMQRLVVERMTRVATNIFSKVYHFHNRISPVRYCIHMWNVFSPSLNSMIHVLFIDKDKQKPRDNCEKMNKMLFYAYIQETPDQIWSNENRKYYKNLFPYDSRLSSAGLPQHLE